MNNKTAATNQQFQRYNWLMILLLSIVGFTSCYKDKGDYDYQTINDIAIITNDNVVISQGDTLNIIPVLMQAIANTDNQLKFEWSVNIPGPTTADSTTLVLSNKRDLHEQINLFAQAEPYLLNYKVTDTTTGITYRKAINLQVTTNYQNGWLILEQSATQSDISFVNMRLQTAYHQLFSAANPGITLPVSANKVYNFNVPSVFFNNNPLPRSILRLVFYNNNGYLLNNATFKIQGQYNTLFSPTPALIQPQYMDINNSPDLLTINNGKLYRRYVSRGQLVFGDAYNVADGLDYYLSPFAVYAANIGNMFFDEANHRFLKDGNASLTLTGYAPGGTPFDPSFVDKKLLAFKQGVNRYYHHAVFKNQTDNECFLYTFFATNANRAVAIENSPDVHKSPEYIFSTTRNQMYYAADNNLYLYDITANNAQQIYSFAAGENVTTLQLKDNDALTVATYNGSGTVYNFVLDNTGVIDGGNYSSKYEGFGKVVNMGYVE